MAVTFTPISAITATTQAFLATHFARTLLELACGPTASVDLLRTASNELLVDLQHQLQALREQPDPEARQLLLRVVALLGRL